MNIFVYPYKASSKSAKLLAINLGAKLINPQNSNYEPKSDDVIINWGSKSFPNNHGLAKVLNETPINDKLTFFKNASINQVGDCCPPWTTDKETAKTWIDQGGVIVARKLLKSHSGKGIVLCEKVEDVPDAPLYTQYIKKRREYRVYWVKGFPGTMIKQKLKKNGKEPSKIQNLDNGYVYGSCTEPISPVVLATAIKVAKVFDLDFGAIDVIWNKSIDRAYVLEINSAPGMVDSTCQWFTNAFKSVIA